ncbi:MAG: OmpA family protein [Candidatus Saccharibacteria bacterium]|nr:OmpA family protein [Pseudorhodobacter sp.]
MKFTLPKVLGPLMIALLLTACDQTTFLSEAGSEVDEGGFGQPTMTNSMAMMNAGQATVVLGQRFEREVQTTVTFAFNRADISAAAAAVLDRQANWIRQFPEVRFRVYGYTDLVGSNAYNYALGLRRAQAAVAYLGARGISTARLEAVVSFGETHPVIHTSSPEERNRRTVTEVTGFTKGSGTLLNGKYAAVIFRSYVEGAVREHPVNTVIQTDVNPGK